MQSHEIFSISDDDNLKNFQYEKVLKTKNFENWNLYENSKKLNSTWDDHRIKFV